MHSVRWPAPSGRRPPGSGCAWGSIPGSPGWAATITSGSTSTEPLASAGLGHGGQVLLSDATRALTADDLPAGVSVRSLGPHRLRDLDRPEPLHQLVIEGLPSDFPPLAAADSPAGNLPNRLTSFVGRDRELEMLDRLLAESALVTLTGPGGAGKTRLAIETARRRASSFADGAWLVRLEGIEDPELVLDAIAGTFGLVESPQTTPIERLQAFLAGRSILLVLDNFEHLMPAAAGIHALLERAGPDVRLVVTSRAPLRIGLEQEFPVGRLDPSDAIGLFVERARRADPSFGLTDENRSAVAEICGHLDGLPLGIELAASRIGLLPAPVIADQLTRRLDLPGVAPRDLPARQRTLTDAIAWSYSLLDEPARRLLDRLSVFAGGFRLAELEAVGGPAAELGAEPIDALSVLVEQSLVESIPGPDLPRYRLLETIQRFGAGRLAERDETSQTRDRHARAYLALAEEAARNMPSRHQTAMARPDDRRSRQPARGIRLGAGARRRGAGAPTARGELAVLAVPRPRDGGRGQGLGGAGDAGR